MPIPRTLLQKAFSIFAIKRLRLFGEHCGIRRFQLLTKLELCHRLSRDKINFISVSWDFTREELEKLTGLFQLTPGKTKRDLLVAVQGFVDDYDKITNPISFEDVFSDTQSSEFGKKLWQWLETRRSQVPQRNWSSAEKTLMDVQAGVWEINGNGLPAIFENGGDGFPFRFRAALESVGANKSLAIIDQLAKILFSGPIPEKQRDRLEVLAPESDEEQEQLEKTWRKLDKRWQSASKEIAGRITKYAQKCPDKFADGRTKRESIP